LALVLFWQESARTIVELEGAARWLLRSLVPAAGIIFIWGVRSLGHFDTFGIHAILDRIKGKDEKQLPLAARGPYRWARHPLYLAFLILIWSFPTLTADRLLLNVLWSVWVVIGTVLEERDLVAAFGDSYRRYRRQVPMLIPWRVPRERRSGPA
jgi:protein-S-isoprenylcysteine O-methyltransferase Ste14